MKRLNVYMTRLKYGGMELSLINVLNNAKFCDNYDVHLYLTFVINKELIDLIDKRVKIHLLCKGKWNLIGKGFTAFKLLGLLIKTPKCDVSLDYSTHKGILSKLSRKNSKKSIIVVHSDLDRYKDQKFRNKFKKKMAFDKFDNIVCVSTKAKESVINLYDKSIADKCIVIPNYVDGDAIIKKSKEEITEDIDFSIPTFISIANHVEEYKNINLIIESAKVLKDKQKKFQILLVGEGPDTHSYIDKINEYGLNDYVKVLGSKKNPFPYLLKSNALLFTSFYEGYGMVLDEARVLGIPIISTGSGASKEICNQGYGVVTDNITDAMVEYFDNKKTRESVPFNYQKHNSDITKKYQLIVKKEE